MTAFKVGDIVEYRSLAGDIERGTVVEVAGLRCKVEYSPWGDAFWASAEHLNFARMSK